MFKQILDTFITIPFSHFFKFLKNGILYFFGFLKESLLLRFEKQTQEEIIREAKLIFRILILFILFDQSQKEFFNKKDGNFLTEIGIELTFSIIYLLFFLVNYYHGLLFNRLLKSEALTSFSTRLWNFYAVVLILFLQLFKGLEGNDQNTLSITLNNAGFIFGHLSFFYILQVRKKQFRKRYILFILSFTLLILIEIFFTAIITKTISN